GAGPAPYRLDYTFRCVLGARRPTPAMRARAAQLDRAPAPEADGTLRPGPRVESDRPEVATLARQLAGDRAAPPDLARAFFDHVAGLTTGPSEGDGGALDCLHSGGCDAGAKSRLLVALCRCRGLPARVVTGLIL